MREPTAKPAAGRPRRKGKGRGGRRGGWEDQPKREGIRRRSGDARAFNDNLGPLRRFLLSRVGRPWDKVYSEVCARAGRSAAVPARVRDEVFRLVAVHAVLIDGVLCHGEGRAYGEPLRPRWGEVLYVCPKSGLLKRVKATRQDGRRRPPARLPAPVRVS